MWCVIFVAAQIQGGGFDFKPFSDQDVSGVFPNCKCDKYEMRNFINIVENASQLPQIWYHGTESDPTELADDIIESGTLFMWFSDDYAATQFYGQNCIVGEIDLSDCLHMSGDEFEDSGLTTNQAAAQANRDGYTGIVISDIVDGAPRHYHTVCCVFDADIITPRPYAEWDDELKDIRLL